MNGVVAVLECNNYNVDLLLGSHSNEGNNQMEQVFISPLKRK